jgi:hypothetical protein
VAQSFLHVCLIFSFRTTYAFTIFISHPLTSVATTSAMAGTREDINLLTINEHLTKTMVLSTQFAKSFFFLVMAFAILLPRNVSSFRHSSRRASRSSHYLLSQYSPTPSGFRNILSIRGGRETILRTSLQSTFAVATVAALEFSKTQPFLTAAIVCGTKAAAADVVAQQRQLRLMNSKSKLDKRRIVSFCVYGAFYQGMAQEFIYNNVYTSLFGAETTVRVVLTKVLFDAFFHNALLCLPMAYLTKAFIYRFSVGEALRRYADDVKSHGLLIKYYSIWMPVNFMIFTIVPTHLRITVMAMISFFWMIILSTISSRARDSASINTE